MIAAAKKHSRMALARSEHAMSDHGDIDAVRKAAGFSAGYVQNEQALSSIMRQVPAFYFIVTLSFRDISAQQERRNFSDEEGNYPRSVRQETHGKAAWKFVIINR
jgi:hypothetical protein